MDSTLMGQSFFLNVKDGFCNKRGQGCTVLAGQAGLMYTNGKPANPSNGRVPISYISDAMTCLTLA
jgi:hypothetical protein